MAGKVRDSKRSSSSNIQRQVSMFLDVAANLPPKIRSQARVIVLLCMLSECSGRGLTIDFYPQGSDLHLNRLKIEISPSDYS